MTAIVFVDTNVLVYSRDTGQGEKQAAATDWLVGLVEAATPRVSFQVMVELYDVVTRKLATPLPTPDARELVRSLLAWDPLGPSAALLGRAWDIQDRYDLSWWDSQIVAAAQLQDCDYLITEDLQHGQRYGDLTVVNPFLTTLPEALK